ncbi:MAG: phosphoribosylanthranilate isomerase [Bacillota bacterium]
MTQIKICGMTRRKDIEKAVELRVDALGFILAKSPRQVKLEQVAKLTTDIPPFVARVGVVVDPDSQLLERILASHLFDYLQFHGNEKPGILKSCPLMRIKAISISTPADLKQVEKYRNCVDYFLFDTKVDDRRGGTGEVFNWDYLQDINPGLPIILAGGLGPDNIKTALEQVKPAAVDLNSRLESEPGVKDLRLMEEIVDKINSN